MKEKKKLRGVGSILLSSILMACAAYGIPVIIKSENRSTLIKIVVAAVLFFALDYLFIRFTNLKKKSARVIAGIGMSAINICAVFCVALYCLAPSLLFYPNMDMAIYEEVKAYSNVEEVLLESENGQINGWFLHNADDKAPLIIYYTGNGENASRRIQCIQHDALDMLFEGYNFAVFSYPGYENSDGSPSSDSLKTMGLAVYDGLAARDDVDKDNIYLWGFSIGTGVANYVAANRDIQGLLLMAPYSNGYDLYNRFVPIFYGPFKLLMAFDMKADQFAKNVQVMPTILASKSDEVVAYSSSEKLSQHYPKGCNFNTFETAKHNDYWHNEQAFEIIIDYFRKELAQ